MQEKGPLVYAGLQIKKLSIMSSVADKRKASALQISVERV